MSVAKRYLLKPGEGEELDLVLDESEVGDPGPGEVRVKVEAASLNYRDLLMRSGKSASSGDKPVVPLSDGAGTVVAVGEGVGEWKEGDRVAGTFFRDWQDGRFDMAHHKAARGGSCDGMLAQELVAPAHSFVHVPDPLSVVEAAALPCAAVTAWHALMERGRPLGAGQSVLCLGTGGVSVCALQIAKAAGARAIVTSSSDEKLERARSIGADDTINYREFPEWHEQVFALTDKRGVDHVIEVGGPGTLERSMSSVAAGGSIALIGVLTGFDAPDASLFPLVARNVDLSGIYVGSRAMFSRMNAFFVEHSIRPVVDRTFGFDEASEAYAHLRSGAHFGKIVITL